MKTIKIIDLLNKIVNGEMIGTKFKYDNDYFMVGDSGQINRYADDRFSELEYAYDNLGLDYDGLNDEIEIIEEEKDDFNGIRYYKDGICYMSFSSEPVKTQDITIEKEIKKIDFRTLNTQKEKNRSMKDTINELIDAVNELKREK